MMAITLWQPYASLVAEGHKRIETRSWRTSYRGPLAIHAAKLWNEGMEQSLYEWPGAGDVLRHPNNLPLGSVIAVARLDDCVRMTEATLVAAVEEMEKAERAGGHCEYHWGEYVVGRFMWILRDISPIRPVPAAGRQGLWEWAGPGGDGK